MASPEAELAQAFHRSGSLFLRFYGTVLKGEAQEEQFVREQSALVGSVAELAKLLRENAGRLHTQEREGVHDGHEHPSLRDECASLATGIELTVERMGALVQAVPSMSESETLTPLARMRDRLQQMGRKVLVIAATFEEVDRLARAPKPDPLHLVRSEDRLAQLMVEVGDLLRTTREDIAVTIVELRLTVKGP